VVSSGYELFEPEPNFQGTVDVNETKFRLEGDRGYIWSAVDVETFEAVHIEVLPA